MFSSKFIYEKKKIQNKMYCKHIYSEEKVFQHVCYFNFPILIAEISKKQRIII